MVIMVPEELWSQVFAIHKCVSDRASGIELFHSSRFRNNIRVGSGCKSMKLPSKEPPSPSSDISERIEK